MSEDLRAEILAIEGIGEVLGSSEAAKLRRMCNNLLSLQGEIIPKQPIFRNLPVPVRMALTGREENNVSFRTGNVEPFRMVGKIPIRRSILIKLFEERIKELEPDITLEDVRRHWSSPTESREPIDVIQQYLTCVALALGMSEANLMEKLMQQLTSRTKSKDEPSQIKLTMLAWTANKLLNNPNALARAIRGKGNGLNILAARIERLMLNPPSTRVKNRGTHH